MLSRRFIGKHLPHQNQTNCCNHRKERQEATWTQDPRLPGPPPSGSAEGKARPARLTGPGSVSGRLPFWASGKPPGPCSPQHRGLSSGWWEVGSQDEDKAGGQGAWEQGGAGPGEGSQQTLLPAAKTEDKASELQTLQSLTVHCPPIKIKN